MSGVLLHLLPGLTYDLSPSLGLLHNIAAGFLGQIPWARLVLSVAKAYIVIKSHNLIPTVPQTEEAASHQQDSSEVY